MVRDEEIERIAVQEAIRHETERGWVIESVEKDNRGFDIISRKPHPHDDKTFTDVRFIEVKGRAAVGEIALSDNEYKTAERLKKDYWLYVVSTVAQSRSCTSSMIRRVLAGNRWSRSRTTISGLTRSSMRRLDEFPTGLSKAPYRS